MTKWEGCIYTVYIKHIQYAQWGGDFINILISNSSGVPIYEQIVKSIKDAILKGELKEEEMLPSIRGLASDIRVSVITTKRAYEELEKEGYIYTVKGKGSYVSPQNKELLKEEKLREIELKLIEALDIGKSINIGFEEIVNMLKTLEEL